jgi:peptidoglycan/xylan/chitin deacetylase (PgdA/CDA1 family)
LRLGTIVVVATLVALLLPGAVASDRAPPRPVAVAPAATKRIAISFDDVPRGAGAYLSEDERTQQLIAALRSAGVTQAAFFVNPARVGARNEAHVAAYVAAGHVIGDHTFHHLRASRVSATAFLADVDRAEAWLKGRPGYRPWLRFPFLDAGGKDRAKAEAIRAGMAQRGLHNAYITVDGDDWNMERLAAAARAAGRPVDFGALRDLYVETHVESADFTDALARRALGRSPAHVLLLHETDLAALFLPDLIAALRRDGWEIVTADQAYADPMHDAVPNSPTANGTLIEQFAWQKHLSAPRWYARNDIAFATQLFEQRVMHEPGPDQQLAVR